MTNRRANDIGGLPAGPIDTSDHEELPWHREITAVNAALRKARSELLRVDERRRATEDLGERYDRTGYFERSAHATCTILIEKGVLTEQEVAERMTDILARRKAGTA